MVKGLLTITLLLSGTLGNGQEVVKHETPTPVGGWEQLAQRVKYPPLANRAGLEGTVVLSILVDSIGVVDSVLKRWASIEVFVEPAIASIRLATWKPGMVDGRKVTMWFDLPIVFSISGNRTSTPLLVHQESLRIREKAERDSAEQAYYLLPSYFHFRLVIDDEDIPLDSTATFGFTGAYGVVPHSSKDGYNYLFNQLPDSVNAFLRFRSQQLNFGPILQEDIAHGANLLFKVEQRTDRVNDWIVSAKARIREDTSLARFEEGVEWKDIVAIQSLTIDPRVYAGHFELHITRYVYRDEQK